MILTIKSLRKGAVMTACLLTSIVGISACGSDEPTAGSSEIPKVEAGEDPLKPRPLATPTTLTASIPFAGLEVFAPLYLADHFGEFKAEGLSVDIEVVAAQDTVPLLTRGRLDVAASGQNAGLFNAINAGAKVKAVAGAAGFNEQSKQGYWLRKGLVPDSGVHDFDPCDLKGKLVAPGGSVAGAGALSLSIYLESCDLGLDDVRISPLTGADLAAALKSGSVDLGFLPDPIWNDPDKRGYASYLIPFGKEATAGYWMSGLIEDDPAAAAAFVRAIARTSEKYLQGDYHADAKTLAALVEVLGVDEDTLAANLPLRFSSTAEIGLSILKPLQTAWIKAGGLVDYDEPLPMSQLVDTRFTDALVAK